jgi:hypothetical protein
VPYISIIFYFLYLTFNRVPSITGYLVVPGYWYLSVPSSHGCLPVILVVEPPRMDRSASIACHRRWWSWGRGRQASATLGSFSYRLDSIVYSQSLKQYTPYNATVLLLNTPIGSVRLFYQLEVLSPHLNRLKITSQTSTPHLGASPRIRHESSCLEYWTTFKHEIYIFMSAPLYPNPS